MSRPVTYLDHAATTPVAREVVDAMLPYLTEKYGNPSSSHRLGIEAHQALEEGRRALAGPMGCRPSGVVLTGGGTEADVLALRGAVAASQRSRHIVTSAIEHSAVLNTARSLEKMGHRLTVVPVHPDGIMDVERFVGAVEPETALVSIMAVNNELGTIQPIAEIAKQVKQKAPRAHFHVDAVQAYGRVGCSFNLWPEVDTIAVSAHKIYGPKGVGILFVQEPSRLEPIMTGGGQESGIRSGTTNVAGMVAIAEAYRLTYERRLVDQAHYQELNDLLLEQLDERLPEVVINGPRDKGRVPYTINLRFPGTPAEPLLNGLEAEGFCVSSGSACHSKAGSMSHVLTAIGVKESDGGGLRISFGRGNEAADVERFVETLAALVPRLRTVAQRAS